jgi:hypothetical protein
MAVAVVAMVMAGFGSVAAQCTLAVPDNPLTATGLSSLYLLSGCDQTNPDQAVFAEAAILRRSGNSAQILLYTPLIVNAIDPIPAANPTPVTLLPTDVVALWFGSNADTVTLTSQGRTGNGITAGNCVNGAAGAGVFGQVAFCNAAQFFSAANASVSSGALQVPRGPGLSATSITGVSCPSTRDFSVVDQDQSDNVLTSYLVVPVAVSSGRRGRRTVLRMAQGTTTNRRLFSTATEIDNGSDNRLLGNFINPALGCRTWTVADLADPNGLTTRNSQALNELQAAVYQQVPIALVPAGNPMVLAANGNQNLAKLNAYRAGVNQPQVSSLDQASTTTYCRRYNDTGLASIVRSRTATRVFATPDAGVGATLFTFLAARFAGSWDILNCQALTGLANPVEPVLDGNGVAVAARFYGNRQALS